MKAMRLVPPVLLHAKKADLKSKKAGALQRLENGPLRSGRKVETHSAITHVLGETPAHFPGAKPRPTTKTKSPLDLVLLAIRNGCHWAAAIHRQTQAETFSTHVKKFSTQA